MRSLNFMPSVKCLNTNLRHISILGRNLLKLRKSNFHTAPFNTSAHVDEKDDKFFEKIKDWWDPNGSMYSLHYYNDLRIKYLKRELSNEGVISKGINANSEIKNALPFEELKFVDVGCGGGLFCESLARLGAKVVGIDSNANSYNIATGHLESYQGGEAKFMKGRLTYFHGSADTYKTSLELTVDTNNDHKITHGKVDVVTAMEVIEHVNSPGDFISDLVELIKPGGYIVMSTVNKTYLSYITAILLAEKITGIVPNGTHDWNKFIPPDELAALLKHYGCSIRNISGVSYNPLNSNMNLINDTSVNYILLARKLT